LELKINIWKLKVTTSTQAESRPSLAFNFQL
jgi:hypothetical protein